MSERNPARKIAVTILVVAAFSFIAWRIFLPPFATDGNLRLRTEIVNLARVRFNAAQRLAAFLQVPRPFADVAPPGRWKLDSAQDFTDFEENQARITAEISKLVGNTEGLSNLNATVSSDQTYGRKVLEARSLLREVQTTELEMNRTRQTLLEKYF